MNECRIRLICRGHGRCYRRSHRHGPTAVASGRRRHTSGPRLNARCSCKSVGVRLIRITVREGMLRLGWAGTRRPPVWYDSPTHGLMRVSVVRVITSHRHGTIFHMPIRNDSSLRRCASGMCGIGSVLRVPEGVRRSVLICLGRWMVHLWPGYTC